MLLLVKIKKLIKKILPKNVFIAIHTFARYYIRPLIDKQAQVELKYLKQFTALHGYTVVSGPFAGMQYIERASGSVLLLKLIGCYEQVLHPAIAKIIAEQKADTIIDIGCAEGYYLTGLGMQLPHAKLIGYDTEPDCLELTKGMLTLNNVNNDVTLKTDCTPDALDKDIAGNTILICDAEGFEKTILDPNKTPKLKEVHTLIVETHDFIAENATSTLMKRFAPTHHITTLHYDNTTYTQEPFLSSVDNTDDLALLVTERGIANQTVLVMEKK